MLKAVLFDMDGVLFDSMPLHAKSWVMAAAKVGLPMSEEEVYLNEGRTGIGTINLLMQRTHHRDCTAEEAQEIYAIKAGIFNQLREKAAHTSPLPDCMMPGAAEMLATVRDAGLLRVLVTGSGQESLLHRLSACYPGHFTQEHMVIAFDVKRGKPDPEPYLTALKKVGLQADEAIVVENAPLGVQAAVAAGIRTVAVNTGPLPDKVLAQAGAMVVLPSVAAFTPWFKLSFLNNNEE